MSRKTPEFNSITQDLSEFLALPQSDERHERPPVELMNRVRRDLAPGFGHIAGRLAGIHAIAGSISLLVCPQFGVGPLGGGDGLMGFFMQFGELACAVGCGSFFMGMTALASQWILNPDEKRALRAQGWLQYPWLAAASWGLLMLIGEGSLASAEYLFSWLLAAVGAGMIASRMVRSPKSVSV